MTISYALKRISILLILCLPGMLMGQGHRLGVGLGSASAVFTVSTAAMALSGELTELPVYSYAADNGLTIGLRLMEFSVRGSEITDDETLNLSYRQSLLAASLGYEFRLSPNFHLSPQFVQSYMGNGHLTYSRYRTYPYGSQPYRYVVDTGSLTASTSLSGFELPFYWVTDHFFFGFKLCSYIGKTPFTLDDNDTEVAITGALQFLLEAKL
jgi:hypothetical protein